MLTGTSRDVMTTQPQFNVGKGQNIKAGNENTAKAKGPFFLAVVQFKVRFVRSDMEAYNCNPSHLGGRGWWITWDQEFETSLANIVKPCLY